MVLVDGRAAPSCVTPVRQVAGRTVTTLEALGTPEKPDRVQAAFIAEQAAQCGYCTNGMIVAATALLRQTPKPTREQVTEGLVDEPVQMRRAHADHQRRASRGEGLGHSKARASTRASYRPERAAQRRARARVRGVRGAKPLG